MVLLVLRVEHIVACKLGCKCKRKNGGKTGEGHRETEKERGRQREREKDTKHSCANHSQDQLCRFSAKVAQLLDSLVRVSRRVDRDPHAQHLRMNPMVHAFSAASGSRADNARTIMALSSSWDVKCRSPSAVSHSCQRCKSSGLRSGEHGGKLVCDGALSSCHHQLDVSVPSAPCNVAGTRRPASECSIQPSSSSSSSASSS